MGEQLEGGDEAGGDQQRLGDLGGSDGLGVGGGAVLDEVETGHGGEPLEARGEGRVLEPGGEETGGLGPLTRGDDDEHVITVPGRRSTIHAGHRRS